jgi:tetratricopeptide (TPR) repeat protein
MDKKYSLSLLVAVLASSGLFAQDLSEAKKAIQDEQYDKAKEILRTLVSSQPNDGINYYHLGDVLLREDQSDSARYYFDKGVSVKNKGSLNYIGLAQIELDNNRVSEAQANFAKAEKDIKKKDYDEQLLIAAAYLNTKNPNAKAAQKIAQEIIEKDYKNPTAYLLLGRSYLEQKNLNDAYSAFRNAYDLDNSLIDAKFQMAMITKKARAYADAIKACEEIVVTNPDYAPAHREIAEIYYMWSKVNAPKEKEFIAKAGENYKKYINATGGSVDAKMRYADFLVLTDNFPELEKIAHEIKDIKGVNPRIYRYLGFAAYENKHYQTSVEALDKFLKVYLKESNSLNAIGRDYMYLGLAEIGVAKENGDEATYQKGLAHLRDAVKVEEAIAGEFNRHGLALFRQEKFQEVIDILSISADVKNSSGYVYDNYYVGYSYYFLGKEDGPESKELLQKSSDYLTKAIEASPLTQDAYFFKARANRFLNTIESQEPMFEAYKGYINALTEKNELKDQGNRDKVIEAYTSIATYYANHDQNSEAITVFNKVLELDPNNSFAKNTNDAIKQ